MAMSIRFSIAHLIVLLALTTAAQAQNLQLQAEAALRSTKLGKAGLGMLFTDLTSGEDLITYQADTPFIPASNLKLLTTAAALSRLGKDFVFQTQLRQYDDQLIVTGSGDPAFLDPVILEEFGLDVEKVIDQWVHAVHNTGVKRFSRIVVNDRIFDQQFVHPNWPRNQLQNWYCAQVAGINFNDNCLDFYASPSSPGKRPRVRLVPDGAAVEIENGATSGGKKGLILSRKPGGNTLLVEGQLNYTMTSPSFVTIHDPPMSFAGLLKNRLHRAGIEVDSIRRAEPDEQLPAGRLLASVDTPLPTVLVRTNRDSQNLFAECLLKRLGHQVTGRPGNWPDGIAAVKTFLAQALGTSVSESVVLDDGSGMSRHNRVAPRAFIRVMEHMHRDAALGPVYRDSLAEPGEKGTLRNRFRNGELAGQLYAKSGYINGTISLSGYLVSGPHTVAFSMLLNNYANGGSDAKAMMEKIILAVDRHYAKKNGKPTQQEIGG